MSIVKVLNQEHGRDWALYHGDNVEVTRGIPDNSVHFQIFSPPFASLYTYSNSTRDMGNCKGYDEFAEHYRYLVKEQYRIHMPGRLLSFHCMNLQTSKSRDGVIGLRDFRGELIRMYQEEGWIFHSEVCIWKNPVTAMQRTKAIGLLHKQLCKDSAMSRQGIPDYLVTMRKPGDNPEPVAGKLSGYVGTSKLPQSGDESINIWQNYASPVWMDIDPSDTLQYQSARDNNDERHICLATGTLILTKDDGYKPIEDIQIGDMCLTHKGRWRPVVAKACTGPNPVIQVKAQGVANLVITPNHKLWTRKANGDRARQSAMKSDPAWVRSDETKGDYVNLKLPPIEMQSDLGADEWWIVGRWLADGHYHEPRQSLHISVGRHKYDDLVATLGHRAGSTHDTGTSLQIRINDPDKRLREVILKCGKGAANKHLPPEAYTLPTHLARALLEGYLSGDGHYLESRDKWMASSVSRALLLGLAMIAQRALGVVASVYAGRKGGQATIEGRTVNTRQDWVMCFNASPDKDFSPFILDDGSWKKVRSVDSAGEAVTWSLQVEEDASYTAEGCIVKNCPLQLGVIRRALQLWTNPGDTVLDPFNGIGSSGHVALQMGRKYVGIELKESYYNAATNNLYNTEMSQQAELPLFAI